MGPRLVANKDYAVTKKVLWFGRAWGLVKQLTRTMRSQVTMGSDLVVDKDYVVIDDGSNQEIPQHESSCNTFLANYQFTIYFTLLIINQYIVIIIFFIFFRVNFFHRLVMLYFNFSLVYITNFMQQELSYQHISQDYPQIRQLQHIETYIIATIVQLRVHKKYNQNKKWYTLNYNSSLFDPCIAQKWITMVVYPLDKDA